MANSEMKQLVARRAIIKGHLTQFKNYLSDYANQPDPVKLSVKVKRLAKSFESFEEVQQAIELLDTASNQAAERETIEEQYDDLITAAEKLQHPTTTGNQSSCISPSMTSSGPNGVKLPKIDLPRFEGKTEHWLNFKAQFISLIDNQVCLTDTQKFHYLKSALSGEAAETINAVDSTGDNYAHAWELLNRTYANKRVMVWRHGELILETPPIERNSSSSIRRLTNNVRQHLKSLKSLGEPVDTWDTVIILNLLPKLDRETRMDFEKTLVADQIPTLDCLLDFLMDKARHLDAGEHNARQATSFAKIASKPYTTEATRSRSRPQHTFNTSIMACPLCKSSTHRIYDCESLRSKSVPERARAIAQANLCSNCLRKGHSSSQCRSMKCRICDGLHHTLLHQETEEPSTDTEPTV
ncbi:uncharacterized protein LOC143422648 [Xylocopa sonorina]|uniref:uncharacterized protein LOC143422648 n=1 Tax=Xylocopa sonorina TaxID=1818115 RepID=UPI00403AD189